VTAEIERRRMLAWLAAATGVLLAAPGLACSSDDPHAAPATTSQPREDLLAAVQHVGTAYLRAHPDEADEATLLAGLPKGIDADGDALVLMRAVEDAVAADYANGRVVVVDGWRLAQTGARVAALVSLST
jgi:hypothetical protein